MNYYYKVFGLVCLSDIPLPAFIETGDDVKPDFKVHLTNEIPSFKQSPDLITPYYKFNQTEFYYQVADLSEYFIRGGNEIFIKPVSEDWNSIFLFFYSNCIAALLFQRNLIPFHVSGIRENNGRIWLFAGPSGIGKSTLALKLTEKGYQHFTDDTALIYPKDGQCLSVPSYPMIRAWKPTLENQFAFDNKNAAKITGSSEKYSIFFHDKFLEEPALVKGIIFLENQGNRILGEKMKPKEGMFRLANNIYRKQWIDGMRKQTLQFQYISRIAQTVPFWMANRPKNDPGFDTFTDVIINQIFNAN